MRSRLTIEFLGTWETMYNPNFNVDEFNNFRMEAGLPSFVLSPKNWVEKTNAVKKEINELVEIGRELSKFIAQINETEL